MMNAVKQRIHRLEVASGQQEPVYAVYLADGDDVVQLSMQCANEHARMPAALWLERYPTAQIVGSLGAITMWDAL